MTTPDDDFPPRLRVSGSAEQRALLDAAEGEAPNAAKRAEGMRHVLASRAVERRGSRARYAALGALALAASAGLWWRAHLPAPPSVVGESRNAVSSAPRVTPSSLAMREVLAPCSPATVAGGSEPLIDDFEDGDTQLPWIERRGGFWILFNDGTGVQKPRPGTLFSPEKIPGGRGSSQRALHTSGGKFSKWGAVLSTELSPRRCYDAAAYDGIQFWARGRGKLVVAAMITQLVSEKYGGSCVGECLDAHVATVELHREWTLHHVRWTDLAQVGPGPLVPFDARSLFSFSFTSKPDQTPFDYWIDDFSFIVRGEAPSK